MKHNILIAELLYPKGHRTLDDKLIELFASIANVEVCNYNGYFKNKWNKNILYTNIPLQIIFRKHEPFIRLGIVINLLIIKLFCRNKFDTIVLLSSNSYISKIIQFIFPKKNVFTIHHNDIDSMLKYNTISLFQSGMSNVKHIVFSERIKELLIQHTGCKQNCVFSIPHPITINDTNESIYRELNSQKKCIVGIGLSNDESFINKCIEIDRKLNKPLHYKIILRSKVTKYEGNSLSVIKGFLNESEYNAIYKSAYSIVLLYPEDFIMRYSGTFINAVLLVGRVISNKIEMSLAEKKKYPNLIKIIETPIDLFTLDSQYFISSPSKEDRDRFLEEHSDTSIINFLKQAFEK